MSDPYAVSLDVPDAVREMLTAPPDPRFIEFVRLWQEDRERCVFEALNSACEVRYGKTQDENEEAHACQADHGLQPGTKEAGEG